MCERCYLRNPQKHSHKLFKEVLHWEVSDLFVLELTNTKVDPVALEAAKGRSVPCVLQTAFELYSQRPMVGSRYGRQITTANAKISDSTINASDNNDVLSEEFQFLSYQEVFDAAKALGCGLTKLGVKSTHTIGVCT